MPRRRSVSIAIAALIPKNSTPCTAIPAKVWASWAFLSASGSADAVWATAFRVKGWRTCPPPVSPPWVGAWIALTRLMLANIARYSAFCSGVYFSEASMLSICGA